MENNMNNTQNALMSKELSKKKKYHTFKGKTMKLRDVLPMIRMQSYSNYDESGSNIILALECEEWTHVVFNQNSGLLDVLGDLTVTSIDAEDNDIVLWIKTDDFNWFDTGSENQEVLTIGEEK